MLALFEVLSFKGWLDVRDVLINQVGPVCKKCTRFPFDDIPHNSNIEIPELVCHFRFMPFTFTCTFSWAV